GGGAAGRDRGAGALRALAQSDVAGEDGRYGRRDQRWPPDPGRRSGLARAGVSRLRLSLRATDRALCGGPGDFAAALTAWPRRFRRRALPGARLRAAAAWAAAGWPTADDRRAGEPAAAARSDRPLRRHVA